MLIHVKKGICLKMDTVISSCMNVDTLNRSENVFFHFARSFSSRKWKLLQNRLLFLNRKLKHIFPFRRDFSAHRRKPNVSTE